MDDLKLSYTSRNETAIAKILILTSCGRYFVHCSQRNVTTDSDGILSRCFINAFDGSVDFLKLAWTFRK